LGAMTLEELAARCNASVTLEINEHRTSYQSVDDYLTECQSRSDEGRLNIVEGAIHRMIETNTIVRLQFYPTTPVGFIEIWGATVDEVLAEAETCFK